MIRPGLPKLIATDLDGTLVRSDDTVSAYTHEVLARVKAAGIRMPLLQVIDFHHHRQPYLAHGRGGRPALVLQTRCVLCFKARDPRGAGGPGDVQKPTDTALRPALRIERNDLLAGLSPRRIAVVVEQGQLPRGGGEQLVPELFDAVVADAVGTGMKEDPGQFPVPEAVVEAFEPLEFFHHLGGHPPPAHREDLERVGEETQHALRLKAALEGADRFGVGVGFPRPLAGGTILQEDQGTDEFVTLLYHVVEGQLGVINV